MPKSLFDIMYKLDPFKKKKKKKGYVPIPAPISPNKKAKPPKKKGYQPKRKSKIQQLKEADDWTKDS